MAIEAEQLGELLDRYWPVLVAWIGGPRDEAEDAVQAAFIKLSTEDPMPENCRAWLFTVTKRIATNERIARRKRTVREQEAVLKRPISDDRQPQCDRQDVHGLLAELDERQREIVVAKIWGELTFEEIAALVGESKATVWRTYQAGIAILRNMYRSDRDG